MVSNKIRAVRLLRKSEQKTCVSGMGKLSSNPNIKVLQSLQHQNRPNSFENLTDQQLIGLCVQNNTSNTYWKEFYKRFNRFIDKRILKTMHEIEIKCTTELSDTISGSLIEKIHGENILAQAIGHENFRAWLATVIRNLVLDWNREQKLQKNAYRYAVEHSITSLDNYFITGRENIRLGETIADQKTNPQFHDYAHNISERVELLLRQAELLPHIQRLIFKISIIFYNPLSDDDIQEIADLRGVTPSKIKQEVHAIMNHLVETNNRYEHQQNLVAIKRAYLARLNHQFYELEKNKNIPERELIRVKKEIAQKTKQLENYERKTEKTQVYPETRQVANLLGISKTKEKSINVWLHRARQALRKISEYV